MKAYVGDVSKSEVIKSIYDEFRTSLLDSLNVGVNSEDVIPSLSLEDADKYALNDYISYINNIFVNIGLNGSYIEFDDSYASLYIRALYNLKKDKCLIINNPRNSGMFALINENNAKIKELNDKIKSNKTQIKILGIDPYSNYDEMSNKNIIKNNDLENIKYEAFQLYQDIIKYEQELVNYKLKNNEIMINMINESNVSKSK